MFVDHIYLINRDVDTHRLKEVQKELWANDICFERWRAIDGDKEFVKCRGQQTSAWNKRAAALVQTTIDILNDAKKNKYNSIMIFEDDVKFVRRWREYFDRAVASLPENWDLFFLHVTNPGEKKYFAKNLSVIKNGWSCQAYCINSHVYDELIRYASHYDEPIDACTIRIQARGNSYCTTSDVVSHGVNLSTIRGRIFNHLTEA